VSDQRTLIVGFVFISVLAAIVAVGGPGFPGIEQDQDLNGSSITVYSNGTATDVNDSVGATGVVTGYWDRLQGLQDAGGIVFQIIVGAIFIGTAVVVAKIIADIVPF